MLHNISFILFLTVYITFCGQTYLCFVVMEIDTLVSFI